ncbi:MAG: FxsA cytoplasmic rane protein, partial [Alphaproteobacteria bacterium]|nr:FxsA cytoplasmic rane protein [Alphaproteobacteria bacterium]
MSLLKWTFIGLLLLPVAEMAVFLLVAAMIGWLWAVALFVATSLAGVLLLRQTGRAELERF